MSGEMGIGKSMKIRIGEILSATTTAVGSTVRMAPARVRHLAEHRYSLGPQPVWQYIHEIIGGADPVEQLERYGELDRDVVRQVGADEMPPKAWPARDDKDRRAS